MIILKKFMLIFIINRFLEYYFIECKSIKIQKLKSLKRLKTIYLKCASLFKQIYSVLEKFILKPFLKIILKQKPIFNLLKNISNYYLMLVGIIYMMKNISMIWRIYLLHLNMILLFLNTKIKHWKTLKKKTDLFWIHLIKNFITLWKTFIKFKQDILLLFLKKF